MLGVIHCWTLTKKSLNIVGWISIFISNHTFYMVATAELLCWAKWSGNEKCIESVLFHTHLIWKYHIKTNPLEWEWARGLFSYCHCAKVCGVRRAVTNIIIPQFSWVVKPFLLRAVCFKDISVLYNTYHKRKHSVKT